MIFLAQHSIEEIPDERKERNSSKNQPAPMVMLKVMKYRLLSARVT